MRPWEYAAVTANLFTLIVLAVTVLVPHVRQYRWLRHIPVLGVLIVLAHLVFEGARWQMVPTYCLTTVFFLAWLWMLLRRSEQRTIRRPRALTAGALITVVFAASVAAPIVFPVFRFPQPSGPYEIGTVSYHWTDNERSEVFSADPSTRRELMAQVWYPTEEGSAADKERAPYTDDASALSEGLTASTAATGIIRLPRFMFTHFSHVRTNATLHAPIADGAPDFPVLIYLTGLGGWRSTNMLQVQELVSHGYIVVGLDQPYTAATTTFPDGRNVTGLTRPEAQPLIDQSVSPSSNAPTLHGVALEEGIIPYLAEDVSFVLDQLEGITRHDPHEVLTGALELGDVGVFGVSLGAITAAQACHDDPRLGACLMMDAAMPRSAQAGLRQPSMWLTRDADTMRRERESSGGWAEADIIETLETMQHAFENSTGEASYYVSIPDVFHIDFTDAPLWTPMLAQLGLSGPRGNEAAEIVNAYTLAFFDEAIRGQHSSLLDEAPPPYAEVTVSSH